MVTPMANENLEVGKMNQLETLGEVSNSGAYAIEMEQPYTVEVTFEGTAPLLFHRWNNESVAAKSKAAKGSKAKKTDDIESYVYRDERNRICIPGAYFRSSLIAAAKFIQDPRSPRKSAMDLFKAGIVPLDQLCSLGVDNWDYLDARRVIIQGNSITRIRPAIKEGWKVKCRFMTLLPEYIGPHLLHDRLGAAGRLIGVGDFRPSHGRYAIMRFDILSA
jgi:hypothetical protein